jgi:hypothetical protein
LLGTLVAVQMAGERPQTETFTAREDNGPEISLPRRLDTGGKRRRCHQDGPVHSLLLMGITSRHDSCSGEGNHASPSRAAPRRCDQRPTGPTMAGSGSARAHRTSGSQVVPKRTAGCGYRWGGGSAAEDRTARG